MVAGNILFANFGTPTHTPQPPLLQGGAQVRVRDAAHVPLRGPHERSAGVPGFWPLQPDPQGMKTKSVLCSL